MPGAISFVLGLPLGLVLVNISPGGLGANKPADRVLVEAARAMGGSRFTVMREVAIPEALPSLVSGWTVTLVLLIEASPPWRMRSGLRALGTSVR